MSKALFYVVVFVIDVFCAVGAVALIDGISAACKKKSGKKDTRKKETVAELILQETEPLEEEIHRLEEVNVKTLARYIKETNDLTDKNCSLEAEIKKLRKENDNLCSKINQILTILHPDIKCTGEVVMLKRDKK